jgi:hypothetical protein
MHPRLAFFKPYSAWVGVLAAAVAAALLGGALYALSQGLFALAVALAVPGLWAAGCALTALNVEFVLSEGRLAKFGWTRTIRAEIDLSQPLTIESHETGNLRIDGRGRQVYGRKLVVRQGTKRITFTHGGRKWPAFAHVLSQALQAKGQEEAAQALEAFPPNFLEPATPESGLIKRP